MDFRPIFFVNGILLTTLSMAMVFPAIVDAATGHPDWQVFAASAGLTLFIGVTLILTTRTGFARFTLRQAFALTTFSWLVMVIFAALPFAFSDLQLSYTDAFFEAMSGVTTTGSTVIQGLDETPPGLLLWRALLQWLGGVGIIVTAVAVLPMLQVGGMQLFRMESSDTSEKVMPRATQIATNIAVIYVVLTLLCVISMWMAGMTIFEAVAHAMTTIATGGFSTSDGSIGHFRSPMIDWIVIVGMIIGGLPFVLYLQALRGRPGLLWRDSQVRWFLGILVLAIIMLTVAHSISNGVHPLVALHYVTFNAVSIMTGTGYTTTNFDGWGPFATMGFFFLMFIGGCAGSTTCGIKVFRFQVLYATARVQLARLMRPHGVFIPYYNQKPIPETVMESVMGFFFIFVLCFTVLAVGLGILGLDFLTSASGAATAIANVGPGLGDIIGPHGNFASLPDAAKWLLSAGMLLGRLELFTVLILFVPSFWRG
jgi:trk system potassium uptake protein TrkH